MRADFSAAIDPIFVQVIDTIDQLTAGQEPDPRGLQNRLVAAIEKADGALGTDDQWKLAKYALVSWIDERLVMHPWQGARWWSNNVLEVRLFNSRICNTQFFELAKQAAATPRRDALCVFHNCVLLGFRGLYANGSTSEADHVEDATPSGTHRIAQSHGLPPTLSEWVKMVDGMIEQEPATEPGPATIRSLSGAPAHNGRQQLVWGTLAAALIIALNLVVARL